MIPAILNLGTVTRLTGSCKRTVLRCAADGRLTAAPKGQGYTRESVEALIGRRLTEADFVAPAVALDETRKLAPVTVRRPVWIGSSVIRRLTLPEMSRAELKALLDERGIKPVLRTGREMFFSIAQAAGMLGVRNRDVYERLEGAGG